VIGDPPVATGCCVRKVYVSVLDDVLFSESPVTLTEFANLIKECQVGDGRCARLHCVFADFKTLRLLLEPSEPFVVVAGTIASEIFEDILSKLIVQSEGSRAYVR
jgi:hypothetical protein